MFNHSALQDIIKSSGVSYKEGAVSFIFTCPRCSKERKLYIRKTDGKFVCFKCRSTSNFYGRAEYALAELLSMPLESIKEKLYGNNEAFKNVLDLQFISPYDDDLKEFGYEGDEGYVDPNPDFVGFSNSVFKDGKDYLNKRGITDYHIKKYQLLYHPKWQTVVFPIFVDGKLKGWQERGINRDFKYTLKGFKKEQYLMFNDNLLNAPHAVLCEGPVDCIKADSCGGNVAAMGKGVSLEQLNIIKSRVNKLYVALDPDATKEIDNVCRKLYDSMEKIYILLPPKGKKDLGECTFEEVFEQFKLAKEYCGQVYFSLKSNYVR